MHRSILECCGGLEINPIEICCVFLYEILSTVKWARKCRKQIFIDSTLLSEVSL